MTTFKVFVNFDILFLWRLIGSVKERGALLRHENPDPLSREYIIEMVDNEAGQNILRSLLDAKGTKRVHEDNALLVIGNVKKEMTKMAILRAIKGNHGKQLI